MTVASIRRSGAAARRIGLRLDAARLWDVAAVAGLVALWAWLLASRWNALPLQLWDESRNANNALEAAFGGPWLTPTFAGAVDHWNTKPPLLIWTMAGFMRLGVAPLLAVRIAPMLAAAACALMVWAALRVWARDRLGAFAAGVLLLAAPAFIGVHGAATGDFDAPESACILGYVLGGWAALESGRMRWTALAALALTLGVLTKGVAATLALPGLALYALARPRALSALLRDGRTWALAAGVAAVTAGYYGLRERIDPGYLAAVMHNELGGRFLQVTEHHQGGADFYLRQLWTRAQPAAATALLAALLLARGTGDAPRRLATASALGLGSLLLVLSISRSKMEWYAVPMVSFLALLGGLGLSQAAALVGRAGPLARHAAQAIVALSLVVAVAGATAWVAAAPARLATSGIGAQSRYALAFAEVERRGTTGPLVAVDGGVYNDAGFAAYNPMLRFEAALARRRGLAVETAAPDAPRRVGERVLTCDASAGEILSDRYTLEAEDIGVRGCALLRVTALRKDD